MDIAAWIVISVGLGTFMVAGWHVDKGQRATDGPDADEPETHAQLPSTVAVRPQPQQVGPRGEDFYSPLPATCVLVAPPYVESLAGEVTLQEWLRHCHPQRNHVWADVVTQFYTRAAAAPTVAGYFVGVDMDALQRHFLAALMMVTGHGLTVGAVRQMRTKHADVRNPRGEPITEAVYDAATGVLVDILREMTVPEPTLRQLQVTFAPLREVIAVHPDTDNAGGQR